MPYCTSFIVRYGVVPGQQSLAFARYSVPVMLADELSYPAFRFPSNIYRTFSYCCLLLLAFELGRPLLKKRRDTLDEITGAGSDTLQRGLAFQGCHDVGIK